MTRWLVIGAKRMLGTDPVALLTTASSHGVANLATACANVGAALVQLSIGYVFAGTATSPYNEDESPAPGQQRRA
jgi:dTDP-4-dehydrorhamnose reductase